jgi:hypothetical protein
MSSKQLSNDAATEASKAAAVPMRLEAVVVPVADVDRANRFYQRLRWRVDADVSAGDDYRLVHLTPPPSNASIIFGRGVTSRRRARSTARSSRLTTSMRPATSSSRAAST